MNETGSGVPHVQEADIGACCSHRYPSSFSAPPRQQSWTSRREWKTRESGERVVEFITASLSGEHATPELDTETRPLTNPLHQ